MAERRCWVCAFGHQAESQMGVLTDVVAQMRSDATAVRILVHFLQSAMGNSFALGFRAARRGERCDADACPSHRALMLSDDDDAAAPREGTRH